MCDRNRGSKHNFHVVVHGVLTTGRVLFRFRLYIFILFVWSSSAEYTDKSVCPLLIPNSPRYNMMESVIYHLSWVGHAHEAVVKNTNHSSFEQSRQVWNSKVPHFQLSKHSSKIGSVTGTFQHYSSLHVKDSGIGKFLLVQFGIKQIFAEESRIWALESGIQLKESGIPLTIGIWNPCSTD